MHTTMQPRKPTKKEEEEEGKDTAEARLHDEMMARELKCEGGSGALPVPRSAVPAGTQARHLLTYVRLFLGGRLRARRREYWPEHTVGRGDKAVIVPAGFPAQRDLWQRIERARLLELEEPATPAPHFLHVHAPSVVLPPHPKPFVFAPQVYSPSAQG